MNKLIGQTIEKVEAREKTFTIWTHEEVQYVFDVQELFGAFCEFRYDEPEKIIGQTITEIKRGNYSFGITTTNSWLGFWAYGIKDIEKVELSSNKKEMRIKAKSFNGYYHYLIYYNCDGKWLLSEFCKEGLREGMSGLEDKINLLNHPKVQLELKRR